MHEPHAETDMEHAFAGPFCGYCYGNGLARCGCPPRDNDRYFIAQDGPDANTCPTCKRLAMRDVTDDLAALRAELDAERDAFAMVDAQARKYKAERDAARQAAGQCEIVCDRLEAERDTLRYLLDAFDRYASIEGGPAYAGSPFQRQVQAALDA